MTDSQTAHDRVLNGRTWEEFCDKLKETGKVVLDPKTPATALDRAEGWRYLTRLTRIALDMMLENADPDFPNFYSASHETAKIGADNPDNIYHNATIDGGRDYIIHGKRGTVPYISFATRANRYAIDGTMPFTGEIDTDRLEVNADGTFEIRLSQINPNAGNWLSQAPDSTMVIVRQTFLDREKEIPAQMTIARIDGPKHPEPLSAERLDRSLMSAAAFVDGTARTVAGWAEFFRHQPNKLPALDQEMFQKAGGDPNIYYVHGYWDLKADEALVINTKVPECAFWNFQLNNYWMESLEYRYQTIHVMKQTAKYNADGSITVVVAAKDPGTGNFIDTTGHKTGTMLLRWISAKDHPIPETKVVKLSSLG